jgi:hypothetical protein
MIKPKSERSSHDVLAKAVSDAMTMLSDNPRFQEWLAQTRGSFGVKPGGEKSPEDALSWEHDNSSRRQRLRGEAAAMSIQVNVPNRMWRALSEAVYDAVLCASPSPSTRYGTTARVLIPTGHSAKDGTTANEPGVTAWIGIDDETTVDEVTAILSYFIAQRGRQQRKYGIHSPTWAETASWREYRDGKTARDIAAMLNKQLGKTAYGYADIHREISRYSRQIQKLLPFRPKTKRRGHPSAMTSAAI